MSTTIQIRRGPSGDFTGNSIILEEGEFGLVLDDREIYIGYGDTFFAAGNLRLITELDGIDALPSPGGNYDMGGHRIIDAGDAVDPQDYTTLSQVEGMIGNIPSPLILTGQTVGTTVGAAGGATALPATPTGYITVSINGTDRKIPYYAT